MHPFEIQHAVEGMSVLCDTREQNTKRLAKRLEGMNCAIIRKKLSFGDYSAIFPLPNGDIFSLENLVCIERKYAIDELCQCFCQGRKRFENEFERAKQAGAKMYLLIEDATFEQMYKETYRSKMSANALLASIFAYLSRYDCQLLFCRQETSGRLIADILRKEGTEHLKHCIKGREKHRIKH